MSGPLRRRAAPPAGRAARPGAAAGLARLGLRSDWDFALHLPLRYEDETTLTPVAAVVSGATAQVEGEVVACEVAYRGRRQLLARLRDAAGDELLLRFLHFYPSTRAALEPGRRVRVFGPTRGGPLGLEMVHPRVRAAAATGSLPTRLTPIYPTTEGVAQATLQRRIGAALERLLKTGLTDTVPAEISRRYALPPLGPALQGLHHPVASANREALSERTDPLWLRIKFEELLAQQISLRLARAARAGSRAAPLTAHGGLVARLQAALPFTLTAAQSRVWREIEADLAQPVPMHRLVQGDVGSGKTVVAALAAARAIEAGRQAALMAPTEILAEQHFRRIADWLAPLGVQVQWLVGKLGAREKRAAQAAVGSGHAQLVVGTQALIQDAVVFAQLGLAIVDEQHRFGVAQRLHLRGAGSGAAVEAADDAAVEAAAGAVTVLRPHLLMLSATPIPRTLAMSYYADLDVSVIDELPPGRRPVVTKLVSTARRDEVLARVRAEVAQGRQAYWVCPLVDESDKLDEGPSLTAATAMYAQTRAQLPELRLGLLHGQLPAAEKQAVMHAFAAGGIDVLVATTVIEVGVDVPRASLMVIEHAQRFGLSQLHQLRGRVGRGAQASVCVLLFDEPLSAAARARLRVIYESTDGFEIARRDLQLRGPGEFLGSRQSGAPLLRFADLEHDARLVEQAREAALRMLAQHPQAAQAHVDRWLGVRKDYLAA